jgi:chromosome segregation ATPase
MEIKMRMFVIAVMALLGLLVLPVVMADETQPEAEVASRFAEMDEAAIEGEMKQLLSEITNLSRRSRAIRSRAMVHDKELNALNQQIAGIQKRIQETIAEKYPTLADLETKTADAIAEHTAAAVVLRKRKAEAATALLDEEQAHQEHESVIEVAPVAE